MPAWQKCRAIYTKRGSEGSGITTGLPNNFIVGYQKPKRFFHPDYSVSTFSEVPDSRTVLYYADNLSEAAEEGRYSIRFYYNDRAKNTGSLWPALMPKAKRFIWIRW